MDVSDLLDCKDIPIREEEGKMTKIIGAEGTHRGCPTFTRLDFYQRSLLDFPTATTDRSDTRFDKRTADSRISSSNEGIRQCR